MAVASGPVVDESITRLEQQLVQDDGVIDAVANDDAPEGLPLRVSVP